MTVVFQSTMNPDMGFALDIPKEYYQQGKRLSEIGWDAWWCATHPEDWEDESVLTKEEVESCYNLGYMDMALELLDKAEIPYIKVNCHDNNGDFDGEMITEYEDWV